MKITAFLKADGTLRLITDGQKISELEGTYVAASAGPPDYYTIGQGDSIEWWLVGQRVERPKTGEAHQFRIVKMSDALLKWLGMVDMDPQRPANIATGEFAWAPSMVETPTSFDAALQAIQKATQEGITTLTEEFVKHLSQRDKMIDGLNMQIAAMKMDYPVAAFPQIPEPTREGSTASKDLGWLFEAIPELESIFNGLEDLSSMIFHAGATHQLLDKETAASELRSLVARLTECLGRNKAALMNS